MKNLTSILRLFLGCVFGFGCATLQAQPNFDLWGQTTSQVLLVPTNAGGGTFYGDPVDMGQFIGSVNVYALLSSNGVAGAAQITLVHAESPTNAAALWSPISNACLMNFQQIFRTNLLQSSAGKTTNIVNSAAQGYNSVANYTSVSNECVVFGIPVRDTKRYWRFCVTNSGSSIRNIGAVAVGRQHDAQGQ